MKELFVFILSCAISVGVSAQEHQTFKGIPIDGHISTFVNKLKSAGFEQTTLDNDFAFVKGMFGGKECEVAIYATITSKTTYRVIVELDRSDHWDTLKSTYKEYKSLLTKKYGEGKSFESFSSPYHEGDGYEISALRFKRCKYATMFETAKGTIIIYIWHDDGGVVMLGYNDKANDLLASREKETLRAGDL